MSKNKQTKAQMTVYDATYNLLRTLGLTTIFGNPGVGNQRRAGFFHFRESIDGRGEGNKSPANGTP